MSSIYIALLRGINVGGNNVIPMKELAALLASIGFENVRTYIQSGNIVFETDSTGEESIRRNISEVIDKRFGVQVPVVLRSAKQLGEVAANNPFLKAGEDEKSLHVAFLADLPGKPHLAALDPDRSPPDRFKVHGRDVYLHFPNGTARSRLTNDYFDRTLKTTSTIRNWRTVLTLLEMVGG